MQARDLPRTLMEWQLKSELVSKGFIELAKNPTRHPGSKENGPKKLANNRAAAKRARNSRKVNRVRSNHR